MVTVVSSKAYGDSRTRVGASFSDIEAAALRLMAAGAYASVAAVRKALGRGSTTTIAEAMQRFWRNQAALNTGNPVALTRLPPEFADAAVALWEQALRLAQQTAAQKDNAAREQLAALHTRTELQHNAVERREREWDMAARVRERALADAREQVALLTKEVALSRGDLRARDARIFDLESQIEEQRRHLATVIARAVAKTRAVRSGLRRAPAALKTRAKTKRRLVSQRSAPRATRGRPLKRRAQKHR